MYVDRNVINIGPVVQSLDKRWRNSATKNDEGGGHCDGPQNINWASIDATTASKGSGRIDFDL